MSSPQPGSESGTDGPSLILAGVDGSRTSLRAAAYAGGLAELTKIAGQAHAGVVVVGASEHLGHRVVGSLAARLVRAGKWPVIVVP